MSILLPNCYFVVTYRAPDSLYGIPYHAIYPPTCYLLHTFSHNYTYVWPFPLAIHSIFHYHGIMLLWVPFFWILKNCNGSVYTIFTLCCDSKVYMVLFYAIPLATCQRSNSCLMSFQFLATHEQILTWRSVISTFTCIDIENLFFVGCI